MEDPQGETSYSYDELNRLQTLTKDDHSVTYDYDPASNISSITYPDGKEIEYTYNDRNLMTTLSDGENTTIITYDDTGRRIHEHLPNDILVNYLYDDCGRLTIVEHVYGQDTLAKADYTLDNVGNRLSMTDAQGQTTEYTYDDLYQLTEVEYPDGEEAEYTYDAAGNRLTAGNTTYTYDAANRITDVDGTTYTYDRNGNLTEAGDEEYEYDSENRLISYTNGTDTIEYTYDGDGERIRQTVTGSVYAEYDYFNDTSTGLARVLTELNSQENYIYGGRLLYRINPEALFFYHQDGLGSISVVSDVYGDPLNSYEYDVFGNLRSSTETVPNQILFTGEFQDPNGLIYLRARYYDPTDARFLTSDTVFGDMTDPLSQNRYVYCSNNPVVYMDPTGHFAAICAPAVPYAAGEIAALGTAAVALTAELAHEAKEAWDRYWAKHETKKPVSGKTAKEAAKDVPSWARGNKPYVNESGKDFAKRLCDRKYGKGNYPTGPGSEYSKIKKWGDRGFK